MAPHNLWLRCAARAEAGGRVECALLYGHHFEPDGKPDRSRSRLTWHPPEGEPQVLELAEGEEGPVAGFTAAASGRHALAAEYDVGLYGRLKDGGYARGRTAGEDVTAVVHFVHHAKTLVDVGRADGWPAACGAALEMVPLRLADDEIDLRVEFEGRPLPEAEIFAHCKGRRTSRFGRTDGDGVVSFGLFPGEWMFIVRRETAGRGEADVRVYGATLTLTVAEGEA